MIKYLPYSFWNGLLKINFETEVEAEEGDLVFEADGVVFLIQRKDDFNNVVAQRLTHTKSSFQEVVRLFINVMREQQIQYIRVQGNRKRYMFLLKMLPRLFGDTVGILKSDESDDLRNIFYIKCY